MPDSAAQSGRAARLRRLDALAGGVATAEAAALAVLLARSGAAVPLPVTVRLGGPLSTTGSSLQQRIGTVDAGQAVVVLVLVVAVARILSVVPAVSAARLRRLRAGRRDLRWAESLVVLPVAMLLVAQLSGITELAALVPVVVLTAAAVLFSVLQERSGIDGRSRLLPLVLGAAVGAVPLGVIGLAQVGAGLVGDPPIPAVRWIAVVILAAAGVVEVTQWREHRRGARGDAALVGEAVHVVLATATTSVLAWLVVLTVVLPRG